MPPKFQPNARGAARKTCSLIDHTLLRPEAAAQDIEKLCAEAREHGFTASVSTGHAWPRRMRC
jgi:deoxyribose-phosphate aldolase